MLRVNESVTCGLWAAIQKSTGMFSIMRRKPGVALNSEPLHTCSKRHWRFYADTPVSSMQGCAAKLCFTWLTRNWAAKRSIKLLPNWQQKLVALYRTTKLDSARDSPKLPTRKRNNEPNELTSDVTKQKTKNRSEMSKQEAVGAGK
eukprot:6343647-Amphidinium_carterae.1